MLIPLQRVALAARMLLGALLLAGHRLAIALQFFVVIRCLAILEETGIARVRTQYLARVLDRAEIFLGAGGNLAGVGDQSVGVCTIGAMKTFEPIEIAEVLPVEH